MTEERGGGFGFASGQFVELAHTVLLSAFHLHSVTACYNSFTVPLHDDIQGIAERWSRDAGAVDARCARTR